MLKKSLQACTVAAAMGLSSVASAGFIQDTVSQNTYVGWWESVNYTHNLNDNLNQTGPFTLGSAVSGSLTVNVSDDGGFLDWWETVVFTVESFDFDTGGLTFGSSFSNDLEFEALGALNADGMLDVSVTSLFGDFYLGDSVLSVETAAVPEPASLALLGLGLAGLGFARRKQNA